MSKVVSNIFSPMPVEGTEVVEELAAVGAGCEALEVEDDDELEDEGADVPSGWEFLFVEVDSFLAV